MRKLYFSPQKKEKKIFFGIEHYLLIAKESLFWIFRDRKYGLSCAKKLMEIWYLLITEKFLFWIFREWKIRSFLERKSWWNDDIYWLLKSAYFELFRDRKHGPFLGQKVNAKMMIFTDYWKVLSLRYQKGLVLKFSVMRNRAFLAKSWCKGNIYLVFLSLLWYSRTWETRFFVQ